MSCAFAIRGNLQSLVRKFNRTVLKFKSSFSECSCEIAAGALHTLTCLRTGMSFEDSQRRVFGIFQNFALGMKDSLMMELLPLLKFETPNKVNCNNREINFKKTH